MDIMFSFKEVEPTISDYNYDIVGDISDVAISDVALIGRGNQNSLIWIGEEYYKEN
ncbi:MAG: hypothetical protein JKX74_02730, partial [Flavobacteriales bacterium]|nr:hypothetical protein [Flavobacteriales bacterium]